MKIKHSNKGNFHITVYEVIAGLAAIALILYVSFVCFFLPTDHKETGYYFELKNEWTLSTPDETYEDVELPMRIPARAGDVVVLERILPDRIAGTDCISFREIHQNIKVYINGELREEYNLSNERLKWNNPISRYFYVELTPEDSRAQLRIEGVAPRNGDRTITKVLYGDKVAIFYSYVGSQMVGIVFGIAFLAMGIIGIVAGQVLRFATKGRVKVDSISWAMLIVAIWNMTQSTYREYFFPNLGMAKVVPYFCLLVLPMFLSTYLDWIQQRRYQKIHGIFVLVCFADFLLWTALVIANVASPEDSVWVAFLLLYTEFVIGIYTYIKDLRNHERERYSEVIFGYVAAAIGGVAQIVVYLSAFERMDGLYLGSGFLILTIMVFMNATRMLMHLRVEKEAAETKSRFLASMSHELRTPINAIMGMNEAIKHESTEESIVSYAEDVDKAGKLLLHLVNDILDFTKLDSGNMKLVPEPFDIKRCMMACYSIVETRAKDKQLEVSVNIAEDMPSLLYGDEIRIQQIMINLLSNAIKYTESGKIAVDLSFERKNEREIELEYSVADTGRGIKQEDLATLFTDFYRADEYANHQIEGTGLGLAITKGIVGLMNGTIDVESTYGVGSKFRVQIPMRVMSWDKVGSFDVSTGNIGEDVHYESDERIKLPKLKLLVVDDVELNIKVVRSLLKNTEVSVDCALNGENAIGLCDKNKYDIILLDHMMPGLDGIETLDKIKNTKDSLNKETPIVVMTANAATDVIEDYLAEGFADYISKPFGMGQLKRTIMNNVKTDSANR